jgi:hypothetical protein
MATSFYSSITDIMTLILSLKPLPTSVLDVGIGTGKYGLLCYEYLTYWGSESSGRKIRVDGIEPAASRLTPLHHALYNQIITERAETFLPTLPDNAYDLALFIDAIEHLDKPDGTNVLRELQRIASVVLVTTPSFFYPQAAAGENPYATHRSFWSAADLKRAGAFYILKREATIALFARESYQKLFPRRFRLQHIKNRWLPSRLRSLAYTRRK